MLDARSACSASWDLIALPSFAVLSLSLISGYAIVNKVRHIRSGPGTGGDATHNFTTPPPPAELFCNQLRLLCTVAMFVLQLVTRGDMPVCVNVRFNYVLTAVYVSVRLLLCFRLTVHAPLCSFIPHFWLRTPCCAPIPQQQTCIWRSACFQSGSFLRTEISGLLPLTQLCRRTSLRDGFSGSNWSISRSVQS